MWQDAVDEDGLFIGIQALCESQVCCHSLLNLVLVMFFKAFWEGPSGKQQRLKSYTISCLPKKLHCFLFTLTVGAKPYAHISCHGNLTPPGL